MSKISAPGEAGAILVSSQNLMDPNLPFGGVKQFRPGRENGAAAIQTYTEEKTVLMSV